jgi:UPF0755 protein
MIKRLLYAGLIFILLAAGGAFYLRQALFASNINKEYTLLISKGSTFNDVLQQLKEHGALKNEQSFKLVSKLMKYDRESVPGGKYVIQSDFSNRKLIGKLRSGDQDPVNVTFNNVRMIDELSGQITANLEIDSIEVLSYLRSQIFQERHHVTDETVITLFIPNTYQFYWNETAITVVDRLAEESKKFWAAKNREQKLAELGLTKEEVYTLASIVEKESNLKEERPTLAGVYLNRIRQGIPLQADPTVVFATGDFGLRRVLNKHLEIDSPYNTYKNPGLPPGPIYMPSINSIDAVLQNEQHDYIFFCARPGYNAGHLFAKTNRAHEDNARKYHKWLRSQNIR